MHFERIPKTYFFLEIDIESELQAFKIGWLKNHVTVKPLSINVLFLTTFPTLKACNSPYMHYYFKWFFVLHSSKVIFSI